MLIKHACALKQITSRDYCASKTALFAALPQNVQYNFIQSEAYDPVNIFMMELLCKNS